MAYLTELNKEDIKNIIFNYKLLDYISYTPIYDGVQNSNYIITTKKRKYIFTIFEDNYVANNLKEFLKLMIFLKKSGFSCPFPITDRNNNLVNLVSNKPSSLLTYLNGKFLYRHKLSHLHQLGGYVAKLHNISLKYPNHIKQRFDKKFYVNTILENNSLILEYDITIKNKFENIINDYNNLNKINIPKGIIHGDLFPDNVLFNKGKIEGFIDFYFSNYDYLISDIAIVIISWCFYHTNNKSIQLNMDKVKILIISYNKYRNISYNELSSINIICKIYCIRFFLTRLIDKKNKKNSKKILTKDPNEYIYKLLYFYTNNINFEQIIEHE